MYIVYRVAAELDKYQGRGYFTHILQASLIFFPLGSYTRNNLLTYYRLQVTLFIQEIRLYYIYNKCYNIFCR